ncbi:MAG: hypothetical protein US31_C0015G0014 [Berkelbacteria bacterium GW2011_GWA1_36_9]|uniref:Polymerase beta nucleotidyltransferase domain-containing protein n=1 Tax=Berkelbacteria bacterium GW2011_GWA1_36_9 TaxID=1618331 RepID=A0A0G0FFG2_9BACT|nr:MAG: hypothetical protein US31_C0015G0014 [Berkelbacteria bacterium GW2011_GWA1_36_9]
MVSLTKKESEILMKLFKDFSKNYNSNSISKELAVSPRGALKVLKHLEKENLVIGKRMGKAVFYKLNLEDLYTRKIIETLLIEETRNKAQRWLNEFGQVLEYTEIVIIFGSIIKNPQHAKDVDLLLVYNRKDYQKVSTFIDAKNKVLFKKIHDIPQTIGDLKDNLKKNPAIIDAIRTGYVLNGYDKIIEVIKDVSNL